MVVQNKTGRLHEVAKTLPNGERATFSYSDNTARFYTSERDGVGLEEAKRNIEDVFSRALDTGRKLLLLTPEDFTEDKFEKFADSYGVNWHNLTDEQKIDVKQQYIENVIREFDPDGFDDLIESNAKYIANNSGSTNAPIGADTTIIWIKEKNYFNLPPDLEYEGRLFSLAHEIDHDDNSMRPSSNAFVNKILGSIMGQKIGIDTLLSERQSDSEGFRVLKERGLDEATLQKLQEHLFFHRANGTIQSCFDNKFHDENRTPEVSKSSLMSAFRGVFERSSSSFG